MRTPPTLVALFTFLTAIAAVAADTEPPAVSKPTANPAALTETGQFVKVSVSIHVTDNADPNPRCAVRNVWSFTHAIDGDWRVTGQFEVELRATAGEGRDREYGVVIVCTDSAGNEAGDAARVYVRTPVVETDDPPVFTNKPTATPNVLSPANDQMVPVKVDFRVVDDVDSSPRCAIRNVWSFTHAIDGDWKITGQFEVELRASANGHDREYGVVVVCTDSAGNEMGDAAIVRVSAATPKTDSPPVFVQKPVATPDVLSPPNDQMVPVKVDLQVADDVDANPRCAIRNVWSFTHDIDGDWRITGQFEVELRASANGHDREYGVVVVCIDSAGNEVGEAAIVRVPAAAQPPGDTTPPVITRLAASPDVLSPPNHKPVPVKIEVQVVDNADPQPHCAIIDVTSNQPLDDGDWKITGPFEVELRATASKGQDREYRVVVACADASGNESANAAIVTVPIGKDTTAPALTTLKPTPDVLSPANGALIAVRIEVEAIDETDPQPQCGIKNLFSNQPLGAGDWKITEDFEIHLRATAAGGKDREYDVVVVCTDSAGNVAAGVATVRVPANQDGSTVNPSPPPPSKRRSSRS